MSIAFADEIVNEVIETVAPAANEAASTVKTGKLPVGESFIDAALGYLVVFIGLVLLMVVVIIVGKIMVAKMKKPAEAAEAAPAVEAAPAKNLPAAPGSAGEVKLYDTDPADAAMIMAIVADKLQKPLNELRFVSIKEVK